MKKQILDERFSDSLFDFLEKGEKVLWESHPSMETLQKTFYSLLLTFFMFGIFFGGIYLSIIMKIKESYDLNFIIIATVFFTFWSLLFYNNFSQKQKRKNTHYYITHNQIIFQFKKSKEKEFYVLPFSEIENIQVVKIDPLPDFDYIKKEDLIGSIFLFVKTPKLIPFDTFDFRSGEVRSQPTLELIKTDRAAELIRLGIKNANASL